MVFCLGGRNGTTRFLFMQRICWKYIRKGNVHHILMFEVLIEAVLFGLGHFTSTTCCDPTQRVSGSSFWDIFSSLHQLYQVIHKLQKPFARESNYVLYQLIENRGKFEENLQGFQTFQGGFLLKDLQVSAVKSRCFPKDEDSVDAETALVLQNIIKETTLRSLRR